MCAWCSANRGVTRVFFLKNGELRDIRPIYSYFTFQIANNKGADQTARMRRLVCACVVPKQQSHCFSGRGPFDVDAHASWPPPGYAPGDGTLRQPKKGLHVV